MKVLVCGLGTGIEPVSSPPGPSGCERGTNLASISLRSHCDPRLDLTAISLRSPPQTVGPGGVRRTDSSSVDIVCEQAHEPTAEGSATLRLTRT